MVKYPKVSIIIINYNGYSHTKECLDSLQKIEYPNYEIFLIDNNSKNNEGVLLKNEFGKFVRFIQNKE